MTGVVVGHDGRADGLHTVPKEGEGTVGQKRGDAVGQEAGPEFVRELFAQRHSCDFQYNGSCDTNCDEDRVHLTVGVIAGRKTHQEQSGTYGRQKQGKDAGEQLVAAFLCAIHISASLPCDT